MHNLNSDVQTGACVAKRVQRFSFNHSPWPFNPQYPNGWRGDTTLKAYFFGRLFRLQWSYVSRENDWRKVDYAKAWNFSPRCAKWLSVYGYYAGNFRYMYHFKIGRICFSIIPCSSILSA